MGKFVPAVVGAVVGAGTRAAVAAITGGNVGKAAASGAKLGGVVGGVGGIASGIAGGAGTGIISKIARTAAANPGTTGAIVGGAAGAAGLGTEGGFKGALEGAGTGFVSGRGTAGFTAGEGLSFFDKALNAGRVIAGTSTVTPTGVVSPIAGASGGALATGAKAAGQGALARIGTDLVSGSNQNRESGGFNLGSIGFSPGTLNSLGQAAAAGGIASAAKRFGPQGPDGIDFDPQAEFKTLRNTLGQQHLPSSIENQILKDVNTPIADLAREFNPPSDRTIRKINEAYDLQKRRIERAFAQRGQTFQTSSDARNEIARLERDRAQALGESEQEAFNAGVTKAIQVKQFALSRSIEANKFDVDLALEMADIIGAREQFNAAIEQEDEKQFNTLLAQILNIGFGGQDTQLSQIATSLRGLS